MDLENLPAEQEEKDDLIRRVSLLKRNAMAAPFEQAFDEYAGLAEEASHYTSESAPQGVKEGGELRAIHYRDQEAIYIKASHDRVTVIFSTVFSDETDRIYGKVFLQEFVDARRRAIQNAPQVLFRNDPPLELQGVSGLASGKDKVGYITFGKCDAAVFQDLMLTLEQCCSHGTSHNNGGTRSFRTFRPSAITFTTTSRPAKHTFIAVCAEGRRTSSKCYEERDPTRRRRKGRLLRAERLRFRLELA